MTEPIVIMQPLREHSPRNFFPFFCFSFFLSGTCFYCIVYMKITERGFSSTSKKRNLRKIFHAKHNSECLCFLFRRTNEVMFNIFVSLYFNKHNRQLSQFTFPKSVLHVLIQKRTQKCAVHACRAIVFFCCIFSHKYAYIHIFILCKHISIV